MQQALGPSIGVDEKYLLYQLTKDVAAIKASGFAAAPECADSEAPRNESLPPSATLDESTSQATVMAKPEGGACARWGDHLLHLADAIFGC